MKEIIEMMALTPSVQAGEEMVKEVMTLISSSGLNEVDVHPSFP